MINFIPVRREQWIQDRVIHPNKSKNIKYLDIISQSIYEICLELKDLTGIVRYRNTDEVEDIQNPFIYYNYGSPAPYLCKFLPNGYGFTHFNPNDLYKHVKPEIGIQSKLYQLYKKGLFTRYTQPKNYETSKLPENYILITMQNTGSTVWYNKDFTKLANEIILWSKETKKNVLFKWHFGCIDRFDPYGWWEELEKSEYAHFDCRTPLNILIENCDMFWTASSMSGIEALICNKPVAIFGETEYMEMTTVANGPEDAINAKVPNDLEQWLTYYVKNYCINIYDKNHKQRLKNKIITLFEKQGNLNEFILC